MIAPKGENLQLGINAQKSRRLRALKLPQKRGKKKGCPREQPFHCQAVARLHEAMICLTRMSRWRI
jgi:hypothetical protein